MKRIVQLLICFLIFLLRTAATRLNIQRLKTRDDSIYDFLTLRDSFYECADPTILDGHRMGVTSIEAVKQICVTDGEKCSYFEWNTETGSIYLCKKDDFIKAEPRLSWTVGVKPTALGNPSDYKPIPNVQAVCGKELGRRVVASLSDAVKGCEELDCEYFAINLNKAAAIGPAVAPLTAWFCSGTKTSSPRSGFLTMERLSPTGAAAAVENGGLPPPSTIKVPCGLNGPVCSNDYVEGYQQGDIIGDHVHKVAAA